MNVCLIKSTNIIAQLSAVVFLQKAAKLYFFEQ